MLPASAIFASATVSGGSVQDRPGAKYTRRGDHIAADETRLNDRIRAREVLLIAEDGEQLGVKSLSEAQTIARERELDLVEVAPNASPPVCRIMDYKRHEYEEQQRRKESRRKSTQVVIKEMKFRPKIDIHDYTTKMRHVERFLAEGNKVKLTIMFRGREVAHPELGLRILQRIAEEVSTFAIVESAPRQDGRNMTMVLHPAKGGRRPKPTKPAESGGARPAAAPEAAAPTSEPTTPEPATPEPATPEPGSDAAPAAVAVAAAEDTGAT